MSELTIWPEGPMNPGPALRTGDSIVILRVDAELARWLLTKRPDDLTLAEAARDVLKEAMRVAP